MRGVVITALVAATVSLAAKQQRPVFRAGIDIVTAEVLALDRSGRPVTDLTAADFSVSADGRPRRVLAAEYIVTASALKGTTSARPSTPIPTAVSNAGQNAGRSFLFLIDTDEIQFGDGAGTMRSIAAFVDGVGRDDLVGVVALPTGVPRVDLTTDREAVKTAVRQIRGRSRKRSECDPTPGEAVAITQGQSDAYLERVRGLAMCPLDILQSPEDSADRVMEVYLLHARQVFDVAGNMAKAMSPLPGSKTIVLVSESLLSDPGLARDLVRFGAVLEQARVRLYALKLDAPFVDVTARTPTTLTGMLDNRLGLNGLSEAAIAGGGETFRGTANVTDGLRQIDAQLGGYYQIAFERDEMDKDNARLDLKIRVTRPNTDVRYRNMVTITGPPPEASSPADAHTAIGRLLRAVTTDPAIPLDMGTYVTGPASTPNETSIIVVTEIGQTDAPLEAIGVEISDAAGKVVKDSFDPAPKLTALERGRLGYTFRVSLKPGSYRTKLAVVTTIGKGGSIQQPFMVVTRKTNAVVVGDIVLSDNRSGALRPLAKITPEMSQLVLRADVSGPATGLTSIRGQLRLARADSPAPLLADRPLEVRSGSVPSHRILAAAIDLARLPAGIYDVTFTLTTGAGPLEVKRRFSKN